MHHIPDDPLATCLFPPSAVRTRRRSHALLSTCLNRGQLDRVNVLGNDVTGHHGCVNALSWARDGEILITSGDDTTVRLWRMHPADAQQDYPFQCDAVIHTGHTQNIFNAQMLPFSSRIATVAGDRQVRVFDPERTMGHTTDSGETEYYTRDAIVRVLRCHNKRVKRIVTEASPASFLTVSEDGTVRQHDLRTHHNCSSGKCPAPLVQLSHSLYSMALSPLTPYQFVVAGSSPFGYLFDRRQMGRRFREEWGQQPAEQELSTCVRRFGRASHGPGEREGTEHVTGVRMARSNGHEVLMSYSSDAIYLYSTHDDPPPTDMAKSGRTVLRPNTNSTRTSPCSTSPSGRRDPAFDIRMEEDIERMLAEGDPMSDIEQQAHDHEGRENLDDVQDDVDEDEFLGSDDDDEEAAEDPRFSGTPVLFPRSRYAGACNVDTVKDVNFLGPGDEFVVSGSDEGNFFIWEKATGRIHDILEGDGSVVNVIEGHPHLPLVAVSGIDTTVKLFAPVQNPRRFSRMSNAEAILSHNAETAATRNELSSMVMYYQIARHFAENSEAHDASQCRHQ